MWECAGYLSVAEGVCKGRAVCPLAALDLGMLRYDLPAPSLTQGSDGLTLGI